VAELQQTQAAASHGQRHQIQQIRSRMAMPNFLFSFRFMM
jgi:hypothetical protein